MSARQQFIYIIRPCRETFLEDSTEDERALVGEHFRYLTEQRDAGNLILAGRTQDEVPIGIAIFEADDMQSALEFTNNDPAVRGGVFIAEVRPYSIAIQR